MTEGQRRMRVTDTTPTVETDDQIRVKTAELIDLVNGSNGDNRLKAMAMSNLQTAALQAIESIT